MGIDIYARWKNQTKQEEQAQYTGFAIDHGHVGYLREAYHGGPYATRTLVPEAFAADDCEAAIPAATLRERLPKAIEDAKERYAGDPDAVEMAVKSLQDFVDLCEKKEKEIGEPCTIVASY